MKVILACGGSSGHINPALAMAEMILSRYPDTVCAMAGRANSMECKAAAKASIPFFEISVEGFHRKEFCRNLKSAYFAVRAPQSAKTILCDFHADMVIGTGGFVSYPFLRACKRLHIPSLLFESNVIPGLAVKMCEGAASATLLQYEACRKHLRFPQKACVIGAPLRKGFHDAREKARARLGIPAHTFFFLSFGGSLGADTLNKVCLTAMENLHRQAPALLHIHACGARYFPRIAEEYASFVKGGKVFPYIEDMASYMCAADVLLCRAGAITLAEIAALGRAAILVPSPNVADDHQYKNAKVYEQAGGAWLIQEKELSAEKLCDQILTLYKEQSLIRKVEQAVKTFDIPDTEERFLRILDSVLHPMR